MMIPVEWLTHAVERIAPYIRITQLTYDTQLDIYLKWENHQVTGSFKVRGALNKILTMQGWELQRGLVTASAGNHGQGVAFACKLVGAHVIVFASEHATPAKIQAMQELDAEVHLIPGGYGEAEQAGLHFAASNGAIWVSAYNDGQIIAGQGTLGLEILQQWKDPRLPTWVVPAGGGGLIAGIGAALDHKSSRDARLVAVSSEASPFLYGIYRTGTQEGIEELPSLADGLAGPVESGSVTIPLAQKYIDEFVLVTEHDIRRAITYAWQQYAERIEGSAATALAAILYGKVKTRPAVVLLTGGNIQPEIHTRIVNREQQTHNNR
jgi:threonine dehydratase